MVSSALHVLLRTAAFVAIYLVFRHLVHIAEDDGLATGLLAFATFALVALVWGGVDGWFLDFGRLATAWIGAGVLASVVMAPLAQGGPGLDVEVLVSDLLLVAPMTAGLIIAPALAAGAVVASLRRPRPALPR